MSGFGCDDAYDVGYDTTNNKMGSASQIDMATYNAMKDFTRKLALVKKTEDAKYVSRNGPGWSWVTESVSEQPWLFGSGGHLDGFTALMKTSANVQKEEDLAMQHMGDRTIDQSIVDRNIANSNIEFNYSQFKTGRYPEGTQTNPGHDSNIPGYTMLPLTTLNGVVAGDTAIKIDPTGNELEVIAAALGSLSQSAYSEKSDKGIDNTSGKGCKTFDNTKLSNPFSGKPITKSVMDGSDDKDYYNVHVLQ